MEFSREKKRQKGQKGDQKETVAWDGKDAAPQLVVKEAGAASWTAIPQQSTPPFYKINNTIILYSSMSGYVNHQLFFMRSCTIDRCPVTRELLIFTFVVIY